VTTSRKEGGNTKVPWIRDAHPLTLPLTWGDGNGGWGRGSESLPSLPPSPPPIFPGWDDQTSARSPNFPLPTHPRRGGQRRTCRGGGANVGVIFPCSPIPPGHFSSPGLRAGSSSSGPSQWSEPPGSKRVAHFVMKIQAPFLHNKAHVCLGVGFESPRVPFLNGNMGHPPHPSAPPPGRPLRP